LISVGASHHLKLGPCSLLVGANRPRAFDQGLLPLVIHIWIYDHFLDLQIGADATVDLAFLGKGLYNTEGVFCFV